MNIGLLLSPGDSLTKQSQSGQLDRFINYYLKPYSKSFDHLYIFSYGDKNFNTKLPSKITLVPKPKLIPYQIYLLLFPLLQARLLQSIDIFRVFQTLGGIPALFINKPFVITYGYHYHQFAQIEGHPLKAKLMSLVIKPILNQAKKIIVTSQENQHYLTSLKLDQKTTLIPNGVDPNLFKPNNLQIDKYSLLTVGRLSHQKNHQFLLNAINLSKYKDKIKLVIIGQGLLKSTIQLQANKLNLNLSIIPQIPYHKLISYYQKTTVFCLTSKIEGQPKVLLEAMSSGCACLTTSFSGNIIKPNQTGLIAKTEIEFAQKLDQLLTNQVVSKKLGSKARQEIVNNFNITKLINKEISLIKSSIL
jgi:glycosyltransferase involved in cell wall biosynthesis